MRLLTALFVVLTIALVGCGGTPTITEGPGGTAATNTPGSVATTPAQATAQPTAPPAGADTILGTLGSGIDAGSYTGSEDPHCAYGFGTADAWTVNYVDEAADTSHIGNLAVTEAPDTGSSDGGRTFIAQFTLGQIGSPDSRRYGMDWSSSSGDPAPYQITDSGGDTAVIHASGTSVELSGGAAGIEIDLTVNCPSVIRL